MVNTDRGGIAGGFDVARVWSLATINVSNSVVAGLVIFVASVIGGLGAVVCCIGLIFTVPYENTINAGAATWFDRQLAPAPPPPSAP